MLSTLDEPTTLRKRASRPLMAAAALASAMMSPLVVELVVGQLVMGGRITLHDFVIFGGWSALLGALLATVTVGWAFRRTGVPSFGGVMGRAMLGGLVYPACVFGPPTLLTLGRSSLEDILAMVFIGPFAVTIFGAVISVPAGMVFGMVFWSGLARSQPRLERPAHDLVAHAWSSAAVMLLVAALATLGLAAVLAGSYCQILFYAVLPALDVVVPEGTDAAWTRLVVLPAPLLLGALVSLLLSWRERRTIAHTAEALTAGAHPSWIADPQRVPSAETSGRASAEPSAESGAEASGPGALPLRESDRTATRRAAIRPRDDGSPYRLGGPALAFLAWPGRAGDVPPR